MQRNRQIPIWRNAGQAVLPIDDRSDRAVLVDEDILQPHVAMMQRRLVRPGHHLLNSSGERSLLLSRQHLVAVEGCHALFHLQFLAQEVRPGFLPHEVASGPIEPRAVAVSGDAVNEGGQAPHLAKDCKPVRVMRRLATHGFSRNEVGDGDGLGADVQDFRGRHPFLPGLLYGPFLFEIALYLFRARAEPDDIRLAPDIGGKDIIAEATIQRLDPVRGPPPMVPDDAVNDAPGLVVTKLVVGRCAHFNSPSLALA